MPDFDYALLDKKFKDAEDRFTAAAKFIKEGKVPAKKNKQNDSFQTFMRPFNSAKELYTELIQKHKGDAKAKKALYDKAVKRYKDLLTDAGKFRKAYDEACAEAVEAETEE